MQKKKQKTKNKKKKKNFKKEYLESKTGNEQKHYYLPLLYTEFRVTKLNYNLHVLTLLDVGLYEKFVSVKLAVITGQIILFLYM